MKFVCTQENFTRGLSAVVPLAGRHAQLPILQNVLLQLKEGVLHLTCTDLELGVHTIIPGKVEKEGSCTVAARKLMEYIQQLPTSHPLTLELKDTTLAISTPNFHAGFPTTSDEDFPLLPTLGNVKPVILKAKQFCQALTRTLFAAARDTTRPEIHSVYIQSEGDKLHIAATDSFRLAEEILSVTVDEPFYFLLPLPTAQEVVRLFSDDETIEIFPQTNHLVFQGKDSELSSRLIDGKYPDYKQIIPQKFVTEGTIERAQLQRALKTLSVFLPRDSRRVQLAVHPTQGSVTLSVGGSEAGAGEVELEFTGQGKDLEVLFNIQYLLEGVQSLLGDTIHLKLVGLAEPAVFSPTKGESQYVYVVMPIQV